MFCSTYLSRIKHNERKSKNWLEKATSIYSIIGLSIGTMMVQLSNPGGKRSEASADMRDNPSLFLLESARHFRLSRNTPSKVPERTVRECRTGRSAPEQDILGRGRS